MSSIRSKLKGMSVKQKMLTGFGVMLALLLLIALQTLFSMRAIEQATRDVVEKRQNTMILSMQLASGIKNTLSDLGLYMLSKEDIHKRNYLNGINKTQKLLKQLKELDTIRNDPQTRKLVKQIERDFTLFRQYRDTMFELAVNSQKNFPGMSYSSRHINPISQKILQNINAMISSEEDRDDGKPRPGVIRLLNGMRYSWTRLMSGLRAYLGFRAANALDEIKNYSENFIRQFTTFKQKYHKNLTLEQEDGVEKLDKLLADYKKHVAVMLKVHGGDGWRQDAWIIRKKITPLITALNSNIGRLVDRQVHDINDISAQLITRSQNTMWFQMSMIGIAMLGIAILAWLLMRGIINPLSQAVDTGMRSIKDVIASVDDPNIKHLTDHDNGKDDAIEHVAESFRIMSDALRHAITRQVEANETLKQKIDIILDVVRKAASGDLTGDLSEFTGLDEVDQLAAGIDKMMSDLSELVSQIQRSGIKMMSSTTDIAATAKQQEATVAEQAASINEIVATVTEISATSKDLVNTMEEVSEVANDAAESANLGQNALQKMEDTMQRMSEATASISSKLGVLNEKANNINNVVTTINKIADQTNLLSLNAAIEAEKAGEYGRGFSVVATEIRRLADQTAVSTWDIEQMVKEMQSSVSAGVMGMDKFTEEVSSAINEVRDVGTQLTRIISQVQTLTPRFESVSEGMHSQAIAAEQISDSMRQLNTTAQQTAESLRQSNTSIQELKATSKILEEGVRRFRISTG